ncbi:envelope glycoprotein C [Cercopithecine alphaherpesvirus 2]|uniref:Envelope glycoprotein C n=1 Tax=Cercopithecine alphaherpesvirus 2 TaxID=10317 RepID=Q5Y0Q8_9ALPH|nr:envelope glycoprotein C [Cercopithecine alphaherpesvirus 2]AAU88110.1 virion glycoprotein C [Cercopithecine alphaherpesvirus 2]
MVGRRAAGLGLGLGLLMWLLCAGEGAPRAASSTPARGNRTLPGPARGNRTLPGPARERPTKSPPVPFRCKRPDVSAHYGGRVAVACRFPRPTGEFRLQIWRVAPAGGEDDRLGPIEPGAVLVNVTVPAGGRLVYDSAPDRAGERVRWAEGAGPGAHPPLYSVDGTFPTQRLVVHELTRATQGSYLWTRGPPEHPHRYGTWTRVRMVRRPSLSIRPHTVLEGEPFGATCVAADYYPGDGAAFRWFEGGDEVAAPERVRTRVDARRDGFSATSTLTSEARAGLAPARNLTCEFTWHRDAVSFSRRNATGAPTVLPRPTIEMEFGGDEAVCTAACVPEGVELRWLLGADPAPAENAVVAGGPCPGRPGLARLRSALPLSREHSEYTCRLVGYPATVPVLEHHGRHEPPPRDPVGQQVTTALEWAGVAAGSAAAIGLAVGVGVCARRALERRRRVRAGRRPGDGARRG